MRLLFEAGAETDDWIESSRGKLDLFQIAAASHSGDMMKLLFSHGMSVDEVRRYTDDDDRHPLLVAAYSCNIDAVRLLLDKGSGANVIQEAVDLSTSYKVERLLRNKAYLLGWEVLC
jgi:ankyrin repeat protein